MDKLNIYCLTLSSLHYESIIKKSYIPVGLGDDNFNKKWLTDKEGKNISLKNPFYGEYTFHYNIWKNELILKDKNDWIGFCTYRRFWSQDSILKTNLSFERDILKTIPIQWTNHDSILVEPIFTNTTKLSKIIKHGKKILINNPLLFFNKSKITIKTHFDMYHGYGNLDKAIDLLDVIDRQKFRNYVENNVYFNPYNMFICKGKKILFDYYAAVFPWLKRCEDVFGFDLGESYGKKRIYGFLAERFLSYWFNEYANPKNWPIYFKNIN
jgi:hypothetical protein